MKKKFEKSELEITDFADDIILTSTSEGEGEKPLEGEYDGSDFYED